MPCFEEKLTVLYSHWQHSDGNDIPWSFRPLSSQLLLSKVLFPSWYNFFDISVCSLLCFLCQQQILYMASPGSDSCSDTWEQAGGKGWAWTWDVGRGRGAGDVIFGCQPCLSSRGQGDGVSGCKFILMDGPKLMGDLHPRELLLLPVMLQLMKEKFVFI